MARCALLPWSLHHKHHRCHSWSSWTSATCRCSYSDEVPFHQKQLVLSMLSAVVILCFAAGMPACLPSTGSHWGWAARRGNSSRLGRSQTLCQVHCLLLYCSSYGKSFLMTNLILVDAQRLVDSVPFSFFVIIGPIELVLCLGLLYRLLGTAVLVGRLFFVLE